MNLYDLPSLHVPYPDTRVQASGCHPLTVEGDGVNVAIMTSKGVETPALRDTPDFRRCVVAPGDNNVALDLQAANAGLVADEYVLAQPGSNVPYSESGVPGS